MRKFSKMLIIVIIANILLLLLIILSSPIFIMLFSIPETLTSVPVKHFTEHKNDYNTVVSFIADNIKLSSDSEFEKHLFISETGIEYNNSELKLSEEEKRSTKNIYNENFCYHISINNKVYIFGGIDGNKLAYIDNGKAPIICKDEQGDYFRLIEIVDNWYALVKIVKYF